MVITLNYFLFLHRKYGWLCPSFSLINNYSFFLFLFLLFSVLLYCNLLTVVYIYSRIIKAPVFNVDTYSSVGIVYFVLLPNY
jgi:hypothetical protein